MADPYITPYEALIYGKYAREQMAAVCLGKLPKLDGLVQFAIETQEQADNAMDEVLKRQPTVTVVDDPAKVLEEARDIIVRFGSYLDSLKGRPVAPKIFFGNDAPSVVARRRLTKLRGAVEHILKEINNNKDKLGLIEPWITDFVDVHTKLEALEKQQRATKVERVEVGPEVAKQRELWLGIYSANKLLIRGLLAHYGKPELLPLIFDDLAEVHRAPGVLDEPPPAQTPPTE